MYEYSIVIQYVYRSVLYMHAHIQCAVGVECRSRVRTVRSIALFGIPWHSIRLVVLTLVLLLKFNCLLYELL